MLLRNFGFTLTSVFTLALGIGVVTAMCSVFWSVALRPLPFHEPERLVYGEAVTDQGQPNTLSGMDYFDYREQCDTFESLAAQMIFRQGQVVTGRGNAERVVSIKVSRNLFETLGTQPIYGRSFLPDEEVLGGPPAVVVSHGFWQRRLDGHPKVIGTPLTISGTAYEIVGIMPQDFSYPEGIDLWFPMQRGGPDETDRGNNNFVMIGRLARGVTLSQAQSQLSAAAKQISETYPDAKGGWGALLTPLHEQFFGNLRPLMWTLTGATVLLLLIACTNVSSLVLARIMARRSELAVRQSLGASSGRIIRQLLVESIILIGFAALGGALFANFGIQILKILAPGGLPRVQTIGLESSVLLITLLGTTLSALVFTLVPAWHGSRVSPVTVLREGRFSTRGVCGMRLRKLLVAGQVALSFALLIGSGLLLRSMYCLQQVDTGFRPDGLLTVNIQLPEASDTQGDTHPLVHILERLSALPGVQAIAAADQLPPFGGPWNGLHRADRPPQSPSDRLPSTRRIVTQGYFGTLGIPLLAGRDFRPTDTPDSGYVVVVSKTLVQHLFPDENPLGKILILPTGSSDGISLEIIGVADDVRDFGLAAADRPAFYLPYQQHPFPPSTMRLVVRTTGDPEALIAPIRTAIHEENKDTALFQIGTMARWLSNTTANNRFSSVLCAAFALAALVLAASGLYGLLSANVIKRTSEIGIRLALGGTPVAVALRIMWETCQLVGLGIVMGIGVALSLTPFIQSQFFRVEPYDPVTILGAALLILICAALAAWLPARRAAKVDPMEALRYE
ncbi:MAG: ABC transporter permease [Phycisphaerales bacterium]|nr:MAG: ABC transporter permease [Phycisphaerales bacterium]